MNQLPDPQTVLDLAEFRRADLRRSFSRPKPPTKPQADEARIVGFPTTAREPIRLRFTGFIPGA